MARKLKLCCPGCDTTLNVTCGTTDTVNVKCPRCAKQFIAKTPPTVQARPVPMEASPQPHLWQDLPSASPTASYPDAHSAYSAPRIKKKKRRSSGNAWKIPLIAGICLLLLIPAGWLGYVIFQRFGDYELPSISLFSDSHEALFDDYYAYQEEKFEFQLRFDFNDPASHQTLVRRLPSESKQLEKLLLRGIRLGKAPLELRDICRERTLALQEKFRDLLVERAQQSASPDAIAQLKEAFSEAEIQQAMQLGLAAGTYLQNGIFDLPAPGNPIEQIYYDEVELVRETFVVLANANSQRAVNRLPDTLSKLANAMLEVAVRRSHEPSKLFDSVPKEYAAIERTLKLVEPVLVHRLQKYSDLQNVKDSLNLVAISRDAILSAAAGTDETELRDRLNVARNSHDAAMTKPQVQNSHQQTIESPDGGWTATDQSSEKEAFVPADRSYGSNSQVHLTESVPGDQTADTQAIENPGSPPSEIVQTDHGKDSPMGNGSMADLMFGPNNWMSRPEREAIIRNEKERSADARRGLALPSDPDAGPNVDSGFRPPNSSGSPRNGRPRVIQGQTRMSAIRDNRAAGNRASGAPPNIHRPSMAKFSGPDAVRIFLKDYNQDGNKLARDLASQLSAKEYLVQFSGSSVQIGLRYSGELTHVSKLLDFGKQPRLDSENRTIHIQCAPQGKPPNQ